MLARGGKWETERCEGGDLETEKFKREREREREMS